jgi:hypothetical protein
VIPVFCSLITPPPLPPLPPSLPHLSMTGYSRDKYEYQAGTDPVCSFKSYKSEARLLLTTCSGEAGASGAAIVDERGVVRREGGKE